MKLFLFLFLFFLFAPMVFAESDISWYTIDGGGGTSTGGIYTLRGTIGQPDTGVSSSELYTLSGGFWAGGSGCMVNLTDLLILAQQWLLWSEEHEPFWSADINEDHRVDLIDFAELSNWWFDRCPADWTLK